MWRLHLDGCPDMTWISTNFDDVTIVTIGGNDCKINFWFLNQSEAVNRMKNSDLNEKIGNYHDKKNYIIAMSNNTPEATTEQQ